MISIHEEIVAIENGTFDKQDNPLKNAPHTMAVICDDEWKHRYTRKEAAFPLAYVAKNKFWPSVSRINNTFGDRNLVCVCEPTEAYA
jgi:glycine dehydrogenase